MKKTLTLTLFATTAALAVAIGVSAWSAGRTADDIDGQPQVAASDAGQDVRPLVLVSGDDDDDREYRRGSRHEDDDDCDDKDDDECVGNTRNPAPAGAVAPPQNGLFGNGAPPKVQVN